MDDAAGNAPDVTNSLPTTLVIFATAFLNARTTLQTLRVFHRSWIHKLCAVRHEDRALDHVNELEDGYEDWYGIPTIISCFRLSYDSGSRMKRSFR